MLFKSQVYTQASGSIGGVTYGRNRGGLYTRGRGLVTNPNTPAQQAVRQSFGSASANWALLTDVQRDAWTTYAAGTPTTNALGDPLTLTGQQMYNKVAALGGQPGGFSFSDGPATLGLSVNNYTALSLTGTITTPVPAPAEITGDIDPVDEWALSDDGRLYCYMSAAQKPTINFFKGPFQLFGVFPGITATPPTQFQVQTIIQYGPLAGTAFVVNSGEVRFVRLVAVDGQGRPSQSTTYKLIAA